MFPFGTETHVPPSLRRDVPPSLRRDVPPEGIHPLDDTEYRQELHE